jgi:pimeloyl-ACP methyl ester carboxylesterase
VASFVLTHGSWHGAWCWEQIVPRLRDAGHEVKAVDLPAHGDDRSLPFFASLGAYSRCVQQAAEQCAQKPIIVGHSMGGVVITKAALEIPGGVSALIYICAFVPLPGESLIDLVRQDRSSLIADSVAFRPSGIRVRPEKAKQLFYNLCSDTDAAWATERLRPDPWRPLFQRLPSRSLPVMPRGYIECTEDNSISLRRQREMAGRIPFDEVVTLEADHSPFLSAPDQLAGTLDDLTRLSA